MRLKEFFKLNKYALIFSVITLLFSLFQIYFALKGKRDAFELTYIALFGLWVLVVGIIDIKRSIIPDWLTSSVILLVLVWRFLPLKNYSDPLLGIDLLPALSAMGISLGFILCDIVTHFGNWLAKFPRSQQGLLSIWLALPFLIISLFVPVYPLWLVPIILCLARLSMEFAYRKIPIFQKLFDSLLEKPWLAYVILLPILLFTAFKTLNDFQRYEIVIFTLCLSFVIEEIIVPFLALFGKKKKAIEDKPEEEAPTALGGGDAMFSAALGGLWGPIVLINGLQMSFFIALLVVGLMKLAEMKKLKQFLLRAFSIVALFSLLIFSFKYKLLLICLALLAIILIAIIPFWENRKALKEGKEAHFVEVKEIPFAPFIIFSAQIILLVDVLIKLSPG